ncbi:DUF429 domain-containing protein [Thermoflexus sp.]|uniref:DUF429 domain-containing protein n=1 Tax=Thermoflexus sp. TaxID=1969742 RepID=UPI0033243845
MWAIGVDLAWSPRNPTAAVVLRWAGSGWETAAWAEALGADAEILAFLEPYRAGPCVIGVDAPLIVPNETGSRPCDRMIAARFGRHHAGGYPVNRRWLRPFGGLRGEALAQALAAWGFTLAPPAAPCMPIRAVLEVFPHPAAVVLFGLRRIIRYKRLGRARWIQGLRRWHRRLWTLEQAHPPVRWPEAWRRPSWRGASRRSLKAWEDLLDAAFCAYVAGYVWFYGPEGYECFGDLAGGYVLVPRRRCRLSPGTEALMGQAWPCCEEPLPEEVRRGLEQFNAGEYFEQHETLERAWRAEARPVRRIYQGILQIGVACYQIQRGNHAGAVKMLRRGLAHLEGAPDRCQGIDVARLRADARQWLRRLEEAGPEGLAGLDPWAFPRVHFEAPP